MKRRFSIVLFALSIIVLSVLTCTTGNSPFHPGDATIFVIMQNSSGHRDADTITDTVGNIVRIGMISYLPSYITSAKVVIGTISNTDTTLSYTKATAWIDTQWIAIGFRSVGIRTVTVSVYVGTDVKTVIANIMILGKSVRISNQPKSLSVDPNGSALFFVTIRDTGTFQYQWVKDGAPVLGVTTNTLLIDTVNAADVGVYTCVVKDQWGDSVVSSPAVLTIKPVTTSNHKPQLSVSGVRNMVSAQACTLSLSVTDTDNGQTHTYAMIKSPAGANLSSNIFSWTSPATFVGIDSAIFTVTDNGSPALSDTQTAYITVISQSSKTPPVIVVPAADTVVSVSQGTTLSFKVQTVPSSQDTVTLNATNISGAKLPDSATFISKTGLFTWTPTYSELGLYYIVFTATDANGITKDTVRITITKTDRPPTVQAQSVNTGVNQALTVALTASDPDNDSITQWQLSRKPHNGTATLADSTKGSIVYTPTSEFTGLDTFTVMAFDGTLWSTTSATVIVTVSAVKLAPVIQTQPRSDTTVTVGGSVKFTVAINNASPSPTFKWYHGTKSSGAMKDSSANPLYQISNVTAADSGNYYVVAVNSSGADTSAYAHLEVNVPPSAPTLVSPANGAWGQSVSIKLVWNKATGISEYYPQVASDSGFVNMVLSDSTQTDTTEVVAGCTNGTTYYWRVNASAITGTSVWSSIRKFTTKRQFALSVTATNGTITKTPDAAEYDSGTVVGLKAVPNTGYQFVNWTGDVSDTTDDSATITINKAGNLAAVFAINTYTISATAGPNGAIFPSGNTTVNYNSSKTFSMTPSLGYQIADVLVDGVSAGADTSYTFDNVSASHSINATFTTATFTITATSATGGTVSPNGVTTVLYNASKSYSITPISGYEILDVLVDGKSVGAVSSHDFMNITSNHTIYATFGLVGPVQIGPVDGAVNISNSTTRFTWNVYPGGAASYRLEVSDSSNFGNILINMTVPGTNFTSGGVLSGATTYYWRVNATLNSGTITDWSQTWSFTTW